MGCKSLSSEKKKKEKCFVGSKFTKQANRLTILTVITQKRNYVTIGPCLWNKLPNPSAHYCSCLFLLLKIQAGNRNILVSTLLSGRLCVNLSYAHKCEVKQPTYMKPVNVFKVSFQSLLSYSADLLNLLETQLPKTET